MRTYLSRKIKKRRRGQKGRRLCGKSILKKVGFEVLIYFCEKGSFLFDIRSHPHAYSLQHGRPCDARTAEIVDHHDTAFIPIYMHAHPLPPVVSRGTALWFPFHYVPCDSYNSSLSLYHSFGCTERCFSRSFLGNTLD